MKSKAIKIISILLVLIMNLVSFSISVFAKEKTIPNFRQTSATERGITVKWDTILGQNYYTIDVKNHSGGSWVNDTKYASEGSAVISNLNPATKYDIRIKGGDYSSTITATTVPEKVTDLKQIDATTNSATFSWSAVKGADKYQLSLYDSTSGETVKAVTSDTKATITGLNNKKNIDFDVVVRSGSTINGATFFSSEQYFYQTYLYADSIRLKPSKTKTEIKDYYPTTKKIYVTAAATNPKVDGFQVKLTGADNKTRKWDSKESILSYESFFLDKVKTTQFYKIQSRSYVIVNGKKIFGAWNTGKYLHQGNELKIRWNKYCTAFTIKWKKVKGASKYKVYMSTNRDGKYKCIKTLKKNKNKITVSKFKGKAIKKNVNYYFYVSAQKKVGKKTYKSGQNLLYYAYKW